MLGRQAIQEALQQLNSPRRSLREAEDDYIRIGNKVYPKDASMFGYDSADSIEKRSHSRYDKEIEDKKEVERKAQLEQQANKLVQQINKASGDTLLEKMFDVLVPSSGKCETLAGEIVRAMMRVLYRDYNDGDVFYRDYGLETCGPAMAFVMNSVDDDRVYSKIMEIAENGLEEEEYTDAITDVSNMVADYIWDNKDLIATENTIDMQNTPCGVFEEVSPKFEYDVDTTGDLEEYIDAGKIDWDDVNSFIEEVIHSNGLDGELNRWARDGFTITNLSKDAYEYCEDIFSNEFDSWLGELADEYGEPWELGDEEEYDESLKESKISELSNGELIKKAEQEAYWTDEATAEVFTRAKIDGSNASTFSELHKTVEEVSPEELFMLAKKRLMVESVRRNKNRVRR